jgi:hypothetical protein
MARLSQGDRTRVNPRHEVGRSEDPGEPAAERSAGRTANAITHSQGRERLLVP